MRFRAPPFASTAASAACAVAALALAACGPAAEIDDITPGGPSSLSPTLDPTYEGKSLEGWMTALASKDAAERYAALLALAEFREEAVAHRDAIEARLDDASASVRWAALETLGRMGDTSGSSGERVVARLDDEDEGVQRAAARAVARMGTGTIVGPLLIRLLNADDPVKAESAADLLASMGTPAVNALVIGVADERALTAVTAIVALGRVGAAAGAEGAAALERAAVRKGDVRTTALDALAMLGEPGVAALRRLAASTDADLAAAATSRLR